MPIGVQGTVFVTQPLNHLGMNRSLWEFDADVLRAMYESESVKLRDALLDGASWDELRDQRKTVTELAAALHQHRGAQENPAESATRKDP